MNFKHKDKLIQTFYWTILKLDLFSNKGTYMKYFSHRYQYFQKIIDLLTHFLFLDLF